MSNDGNNFSYGRPENYIHMDPLQCEKFKAQQGQFNEDKLTLHQ